MAVTDVYERFHLYTLADKFFVEPRDKIGAIVSNAYLEIDRISGELKLKSNSDFPIPIDQAELTQIYGILGITRLISGDHLIVIKKAELVGTLNNAEIYHITETEVIPFNKTTLHLTEKERFHNKNFVDMIQLVLATAGFYYSTAFDLTHSLQWLTDNATPNFRQLPMMERANPRFVWNRHLASPLSAIPALTRYTLPVMHGFVGIKTCIVRGSTFKLALISRRSIHRAGVRFYMRGTDLTGNSANFVETEQIMEFDQNQESSRRVLTAFIQMRGSIPLYWSQRPNLKWQPSPMIKPADNQLDAYMKHMRLQQQNYGGKHVIVNLVNQKGREKSIGGELERISTQANLDFVKYIGFDFHKECKALNWDRLSILHDILLQDITDFGFFCSSVRNPTDTRFQTGYFRTNCMDCLDRTNVVQSVIAKEALKQQLVFLKIIDNSVRSLDELYDFSHIFKNLWADNGDECSKQYAGTGALKADFTRIGKRTLNGAVNDGINAVTRYFKNNFADGYRQDAIDLFLGNVQIDPSNLPTKFEDSIFNFNANGGAIAGAIFSAAMTILCVLISENVTATLFWMIVFVAFMFFIFLNGEEFVSKPKLKSDLQHISLRHYSAEQKKPKNFFTTFVDSLKDEMQKNKELQEHKKILDQRLRELNESEALKEARQKFDKVEKETAESSEIIKHRVKEFRDHIDKMVTELQKTEAGKKLSVAGQEVLKQAKAATEMLEKTAKEIGDTQVYQQVSSAAKQIDNIAGVTMYSRPQELKMRSSGFSTSAFAHRTVEANPNASDIELHKESKWYQGWKNFSENNSYYNKLLDWKIRYDESENLAVRMMRGITERVGSVFSGSNEVSDVLTEIAKIDPNFDKTEWLKFCEKEIIPNILEGFIRGDVKVLEDWCHERAFVMLSTVVKEYQKSHFSTADSRIIDISKVEMVSGKMMDQGPVLVITFQVFMINVVKNAEGKVIQGDLNKPVRVHHVWVMCRDMEEYNPATAWKLLELHMQEGSLSV